MSSTYKRYHPKNWAGVYIYENNDVFKGKPDLCFYICFRNEKRIVWEKVGRISEGYSAAVASEIRAERVKAIRHGETIKTAKDIRQEKLTQDITFKKLAQIYFEIKGAALKGYTTDINRYKKHLSPMLDKLSISQVSPLHVEQFQKIFINHKPATLWNTLELMRRIINFGYKTNRAPALSFQIEMPIKDNEVIEYLKPNEVKSFLETAKTWESRDVGNMLLLAFFTGMRRGELFKLTDASIDSHMKLIRISDPKGKKSISIGMSGLSEKIINEQAKWRDEHFPQSPYLFPGKDGNLRKDCSSVERFKIAAGLPVKFRPFHGLRHHFAVTLANSGKFTLDIIAEMLTHKDANFTKKKYGQFLPESLSAASNTAADILMGETGK